MKSDNFILERKLGADMIKKYCAMYYFKNCVSLDFIEWQTDILTNVSHFLLIINGDNRTTNIFFKKTELEDYSRYHGARTIELKIRQAIRFQNEH